MLFSLGILLPLSHCNSFCYFLYFCGTKEADDLYFCGTKDVSAISFSRPSN